MCAIFSLTYLSYVSACLYLTSYLKKSLLYWRLKALKKIDYLHGSVQFFLNATHVVLCTPIPLSIVYSRQITVHILSKNIETNGPDNVIMNFARKGGFWPSISITKQNFVWARFIIYLKS